jgi:hypothetical protein
MMIERGEVNAAVRALEKQSRAKATEVLARFGAMNTTELKPEQYQAVIEMAQAELERGLCQPH